MFFPKIDGFSFKGYFFVLTLQQNVLSKNILNLIIINDLVLTLQQNVLSKNLRLKKQSRMLVLTLQQNVLSKNCVAVFIDVQGVLTLQQNVLSKNVAGESSNPLLGFDFTTKCSFQKSFRSAM